MSAIAFGQQSLQQRRRLRTELAGFVAARRRVGAIDGASRGAVVGCILAAAAGMASRFVTFDGGGALSAILLVGSTVAAAALAWLRPIDDDQVALEIDRRLDLAERVTTAVELDRLIGNRVDFHAPSAKQSRGSRAGGGPDAGRTRPSTVLSGRLDLIEDQIADAVANLAAARPTAVYPVRQSHRRSLALLLGFALAIAPWVVDWPALIGSRLPISRTATAQQVEADRLESIAKRLDQEGSSANPQLNTQIAAQLRQAAAALRASNGSAQQASTDLLRAEAATTSLSPTTGEPASVTLSRIADALNSNPTTQPVTRALDQQNAGQAASALTQVASSLPSMSPDQRLSVAQALHAASNAVRNSDTGAADQLQQAAVAARNGDPAGVQSAVRPSINSNILARTSAMSRKPGPN
ncbi:MAG TPA: hypothetical protein VKT80_12670 [Chloroflexota bacterium]|nr:hypothetical protein [Chloroflexota bacterium]